MSANLYETAKPGEYYHIHGSLEASTTLRMIGLDSHRPDVRAHEDIVATIEPAVKKFSIEELEALNKRHKQAGVQALKHEDFLNTPHVCTSSVRVVNEFRSRSIINQGQASIRAQPWEIENLESATPPSPLNFKRDGRLLSEIRVLEMCRIIAGPTIARILGEYGADVLKITSPNLSDVPFFQVDGNMGKHATDLDLKTQRGRAIFESLLANADIIVDGYRPGALEKLGYGPKALADMAAKRGKGIVYVNENCFGYHGDWAGRPGWQQIADCVSLLRYSPKVLDKS